MGPDLRIWEYLVGTYEPHSTKFPFYLDGFVLIDTRI